MTTAGDRLTFRPFTLADLPHLADLDRTEHITVGCRVEAGKIVFEPVDRLRERWTGEQVKRCEARVTHELERGGQAVAAFNGETLAGFAVLGHDLRGPEQDYLCLDLLHISRPYRRMGVGTRLMEEIERLARECGARRLYISATPSSSAVSFYFSRGAQLAETPDPASQALEPKDIPLMLEL